MQAGETARKEMRARATAAILACCLLAGLTLGAADSVAFRALLKHGVQQNESEEWLVGGDGKPLQLEGACGVAVSNSGSVYVSDYYHRSVGIYSPGGEAQGGFSLAKPALPSETNAVCALALDPAGRLYANEYDQAVIQLPGEGEIDPGHATGVATDSAGNVYVNDRIHVVVYAPPAEPGGAVAEEIGGGSLKDGYGLAVDSKSKTVFVADAGDNTVKGYPTGVGASAPSVTISHGFVSLLGAAIAVDPTNGHVLVASNSKPGFENPQVVIDEFTASGQFLDRLTPRKVEESGQRFEGPVFGEPSGIAVDPASGELYVTTGNSIGANLLKYGPFLPFAPPAVQPPGGSLAPAAAPATARAGGGGATGRVQSSAASASVIVQKRGVRVRFDGDLTPHALPRHGLAPVGIAVDTEIAATAGTPTPQLRKISIAINRNGQLTTKGLPVCRLQDIQPATTANALAACGDSLVGEGHFAANVKLPEQSPFPSAGKVLAFNGRLHGKPAILAHIYGTDPAPTSTVLPFQIRSSHGTYGTVLEAALPTATGDWGYVTGLKMTLRRSFTYHGKSRSYLSAGCPAPAGISSAAFPLARTSFDFAGGPKLVSVLNRSCKAKG
jgi:DNA-binding beta-propeller fold protein YncE